MLVRALAIWVLLLALASVNGGLREGVIIPATGDVVGRALSTVLLSACIVGIALLTVRWMAPSSPGDAWRIGLLWLGLTVAFEFLGGHYLFGAPWARLLDDYDLAAGRIWVLALLTTCSAPWLAGRLRGLWA